MRRFMVVAVATTMLSLPASAEDADVRAFLFAGEEVDTSFEASRTRLMAQGYRQVEMINGSPYRLSAMDREGGEVLLAINPQTGEVEPDGHIPAMTQ